MKNEREKILENLIYNIEWDPVEQVVYIESPVKARDIQLIKYALINSGYCYKNLIICAKANRKTEYVIW